ncbi:predicted protein [Sclerotinia sclerotiorum 1980 UF-70]|uniref:Uncharacterized protein n=1 Tax=Sclerotinia sclerotiorum (strain ATCC 18683 / 1980 / Ss-1) TaxID=665079 RepID=A7EQ73_SCLS1|nr:predicted protein [Sclerotinia sclerotiorum 1980 UF-70]EDO04989.1 predicted protein [Sclerotinia sclerotiorum 1980 UF-70]
MGSKAYSHDSIVLQTSLNRIQSHFQLLVNLESGSSFPLQKVVLWTKESSFQ